MADHKVQLNPLTQVIHDEKNFLVALNLNLSRLQKAIDDTLSRTGIVPNQMEEVLDMNGQRIINVGKAEEPGDVITKEYIQEIIDDAEEAIGRLDRLVHDAKIALEVYASEYIYPAAQEAVDKAIAAKDEAELAKTAAVTAQESAQEAQAQAEKALQTAEEAKTSAVQAATSAEQSEIHAKASEKAAQESAKAAADSAASIGTVMRYKGSVATYAELPKTGQVIGDVWNVEEDDMNYAWNGTSWDQLGATFNAENYYTKEESDQISSALEQDINSLTTELGTVKTDLADLGNQVVDVQNTRQKNITTTTQTIPASAWNSSKKASVAVAGLTTQDTVFVSPGSTAEDIDVWSSCKIFASLQGSGLLELTCETVPTTSITVQIGVLPK